MEYDNTNSGALFRNERRTNDRQPEYTGSLNVEGEEFWVSAWVKESKKDGRKFFSLAVTKKDAPKPAPAPGSDDDVPF